MIEGIILCDECFKKKYSSLEDVRKEGKKVKMFMDFPRWKCYECGKVIASGWFVYEEVEE